MKKKLKIKFWKTERALAMQITEQKGLPKEKDDGFVQVIDYPGLYTERICLRGIDSINDFDIDRQSFNSNEERDAYLSLITQAITDELFPGGELKVGELCEIRDYDEDEWEERELLVVLSPKFNRRYIVKMGSFDDEWVGYKHARPLSKRIEPKVETNGEIVTYTWEEE